MKNILILGNGGRERAIKDILCKRNNKINCRCSIKEEFSHIKKMCIWSSMAYLTSIESFSTPARLVWIRKKINR